MRYADDIVAGFEHESDAVRFLADLRERLEKFSLIAASGQDAPDRVWPLCGGQPREAGPWQTGDVQLFGVYGRPAYHPASLLKIYIYGYLNRVSRAGAWSARPSAMSS